MHNPSQSDPSTQPDPSQLQDSTPPDLGQPAGKRRGGFAVAQSVWVCIALNMAIGGYFAIGIFSTDSSVKTAWLPGETTHGHYQIELKCNACHLPSADADGEFNAEVMTDACNRCHADQLQLAKDTHPAKKFNDPTNAVLLATLDAQDCLTCHREHVPERTLAMGLTMPSDYCWHCHQDIEETRPSHVGMAFDSCATAGCHNYHDNRALYEKFLADHADEPDFKDPAVVRMLDQQLRAARGVAEAELETRKSPQGSPNIALTADAPQEHLQDESILSDWRETAHAKAGVNCSGCHSTPSISDESLVKQNVGDHWSNEVSLDTCQTCHAKQTESFVRGRHGMRLAEGQSPMKPDLARLAMHSGAAHRELTCNACHEGHRFDTQYAAVDACVRCHADSHTVAYADSAHASLWQQELDGDITAGSGVSCATCHLPRLEDDEGSVWVNHNQNDNLRPNETMAREVCLQCHGLEYSLSALANPAQKEACYSLPVEERTSSVDMAKQWFIQQEAKRAKRRRRSP